MTGKVTDEMLMAYVDGELDPAAAEDVRRAAARDAALARRAEDFRAARQWAKDAFAGIKAEPAPERLVETILGDAASNVVPLRRRPFVKAALPLAASVALVFGAAGYWFGQRTGTADLFADRTIAHALAETRSGEVRPVGGMRLETLATYKVEGGYCRSFSLAGSGQALRGVGCDFGSGWNIGVVAAHGGDGTYAPASSGATGSIDAYLDAVGAREPLDPKEEAAIGRTNAR